MLDEADADGDAVVDCPVCVGVGTIGVATLGVFRPDVVDSESWEGPEL